MCVVLSLCCLCERRLCGLCCACVGAVLCIVSCIVYFILFYFILFLFNYFVCIIFVLLCVNFFLSNFFLQQLRVVYVCCGARCVVCARAACA